MMVCVRVYVLLFYIELNEFVMLMKNVGRYLLLCFTFDDALTLDAVRGNMVYVILKCMVGNVRVKYSVILVLMFLSVLLLVMMEMDGEEGVDVVFFTYVAFSDETSIKFGRVLFEMVIKLFKCGWLVLFLLKRIIVSFVWVVCKLLGILKTSKGGGSYDFRFGVEFYSAGDGKFVVCLFFVLCVDIVYEIVLMRNGVFFGLVFV